jgi:hypothetical protein
MASFLNAFDPTRGDLIYGRGEVRQAYLDLLPQDTRNEAGKRFVLLDNYNDATGTSGKAYGQRGDKVTPESVNAYLDRVGALVNAPLKPNASEDQQKRADRTAAYFEYIRSMNARFAPAESFRLKRRDIAAEGYKYPTGTFAFLKRKENREVTRMNRGSKALRRVCKLGLAMVATDARFAGARIHFLLDGLDLETVATKKELDIPGRTAAPITSSELRYVYRNWAGLKGTVILYVNLQSVTPPWEEDWTKDNVADPSGKARWPAQIHARMDLWDEYGQRRLDKYGGTLPDKDLFR